MHDCGEAFFPCPPVETLAELSLRHYILSYNSPNLDHSILCQSFFHQILVLHPHQIAISHQSIWKDAKWPLIVGVPNQLMEEENTKRVFVAGYHDGYVWIWNATYSALSLVCTLKGGWGKSCWFKCPCIKLGLLHLHFPIGC